MNKRFIAIMLAVLTAGTTLPVFAQQVNITAPTEENANQTYTLRVYDINKSVDSGNIADIVYADEAKSDGNKDIIFNFDFNMTSGYYPYSIKSKSGKETVIGTLAFVNKDELEQAMKELAAALKQLDKGSAIKDVFKKYPGVFQLDNEFDIANEIEKLDTKNAYTKIAGKISETSSVEDIQKVYKKEILLAAVENGSSKLIAKVDTNYALFLGADNEDINNFYAKMNDAQKESVAAREKGEYNTPAEYVAAHNNAVSIEAMNNSVSWMELKNAVEKTNKITEMTVPSSNDVYVKLYSKKPFSSKADYEAKLITAVDEANNAGASDNGGGAGGGSGNGTKITGGGTGGFNGGTAVNNNDVIEQITAKFTDISGVPWAKEGIEALADKGIVSGKGNRIFAPNDYITREEFVKIIVGAFALTSDEGKDFDDVNADAWYAPYVRIATGTGVVKGLSDTLFGIGKNITRQDAAVMIVRAATNGDELDDAAADVFGDVSQIADYAKAPVGFLASAGAINGNPDGLFLPNNEITRAEAVKIIYNVIK